MVERVVRKDDEVVYQPKLHSRLVHELYLISQKKGIPMTLALQEAVVEYITKEKECVTHVQPPQTPSS